MFAAEASRASRPVMMMVTVGPRGLELLGVDNVLQNLVVQAVVVVPELGATVRPVANTELNGRVDGVVRVGAVGVLGGLGQLELESERVELFVLGLHGIVGPVHRVEGGRERTRRGTGHAGAGGGVAATRVRIVGDVLRRVVLARGPLVERGAHEHVLRVAHVLDFDGAAELEAIEYHVLE